MICLKFCELQDRRSQRLAVLSLLTAFNWLDTVLTEREAERWNRHCLRHFGLQPTSLFVYFHSSTVSIFSIALSSANNGIETLLSCGRAGKMNTWKHIRCLVCV